MQILIPLILFCSMVDVYWVSFNTFDIFMMVFIAGRTLLLRLLGFPMALMLLGFILGAMWVS